MTSAGQERGNRKTDTRATAVSIRYVLGYTLICLSHLLTAIADVIRHGALLPKQFALIIWTPQELDRHARFSYWDSRNQVHIYAAAARDSGWEDSKEKELVERYFIGSGDLLNLACGAGREAFLLVRPELRVTACDWSPRMIEAARARAQDANLPIHFEVADLHDLPYRENSFDYLFLTNIAYSYLAPGRRRIHFLTHAYSVLKPGGFFLIAFATLTHGGPRLARFLQPLFVRLSRYAPFNRDYEAGDTISYCFVHLFQEDELKNEFEEARFTIKEWLWDDGYAVLTKV